MGLPLQQSVNSSIDLSNAALMNQSTGMVQRAHMNGKNGNKQFLNTSFDASKSANTINYVNSAYMSAIPQASNMGGSGTALQGGGVPSGAKLSKVGLKNTGHSNSRQPNNIHNQGNNYTDGTSVFLGHG